MVEHDRNREYNDVMKSSEGGINMRKSYLDNIRWLTVVIVVFYHVIYMYNARGVQGGLGKITNMEVQYQDIFQYAVFPWLMPILFIVSGICSRLYLDKHTDKEFIRSRTIKLLVPSTLGGLVFFFIQGYINMSLSSTGAEQLEGVPVIVRYIIMVFVGTGVMWYIRLLWLFSILLLWIRKVEKDRLWNKAKQSNLVVLVLLYIPLWLSAQILNMPVIVVYRFGFYFVLFLIGYFVFSHDDVIDILKQKALILSLISLVLCVAFCVMYFGKNYSDLPVNRSFLFVAYAWAGCLTILGVMARYYDYQNEFTIFMNRHNFALYLFHYLGVSGVALFHARTKILAPLLVYLLSLIAGFAISYILEAVISRIPYYRFAVLGIRKEK